MSDQALILWLLNILLDACGQLALKAAARGSESNDVALAYWQRMTVRPWLWIGVICFVFEFVVWMAFLSVVPLAQGVLLGMINIVVIMLAGRLLFGEQLSPLRTLGIFLIACGVAIVGTT